MFQTLKCTIYRIKNPQTVHIHMQDNTLFIFFKAANAPTGSFGLVWIQMQVHTVCCKDIGFLGGAGALRNLILTEICHFTDFGSRNALWGDSFFFSRCPRAQSFTGCKYSISLWCSWRIMGPRCVSILPLGKVACAGLSGNIELVLVRHAYNIIVDVFFFFWWHCVCPHDCLWKILFYLFKQKNATSPNSACFSPNVCIYLFIYSSTIECCCIWVWVRTRA